MKKSKELFSGLVYISLIFLATCLHEEGFCESAKISDEHGIYGSYAWDSQYVYVMLGYNKPEDKGDWGYKYCQVVQMDRFTGQQSMLIDNYEGEVELILEGGGLYLMYKNDAMKVQNGSEDETLFLDKFSADGDIDHTKKYVLGEKLIDINLYNNCLYVRTDRSIFCIDLKSGDIKTIFTSELLKKNVYPDNMIIDNGKIYVQEYDSFVKIDLTTGMKEIVLEGYLPVLWPIYDDYYDCFVMNDYLYFWDKEAREMVAMNLESKECQRISKDLYLFKQFSSDGVIARVFEKETVDMWLQSTYRSKYIHPKGITELVPCEYVFIRRDGSEDWLLKNEEDCVQIGYGDDYVLIGNGQYLHFSEDYDSDENCVYFDGRINEIQDLFEGEK